MRNSPSASRDTARLDALQHVKHVVAVAQAGEPTSGLLTVFLDEENASSRAEIARWSATTTTPVDVKVIGKILL